MKSSLPEEVDALPITFRQRPWAVPADLRPEWMAAALVLALRICCKNGRSSYPRVYTLMWALLSERTREDFRRLVAGDASPDAVIIRFDPSIGSAIDLAEGFGLISKPNGNRVQLTATGRALADEILRSEDLLLAETEFLRQAKPWAAEEKVRALLNWREIG